MVPLHRIRREIGEPEERAFGGMLDGERAAGGIIAGVEAEPMVAVMAGADRIARPAVGIGRARKPGDRKVERVADRAGHTKMEPLIEIGLAILADGKTRRIERKSVV